jgi:ABC-2 type transport system permease protein
VFGWRPHAVGFPAVVAATLLATAAFVGLALLLAGTQRAELVLAGANGLHIVLLLLSGMMIPLGRLPGPIRSIARLLPSTAVAEIFRGALDAAVAVPTRPWLVLIVWAIASPLLAAWRFRWE